MNIHNLDKKDIQKLYEFNRLCFPERENIEKIIDFWFNKNPEEYSLSVILEGDNEEIWGQILRSSTAYYYAGNYHAGEWVFDYIVRKDKRKEAYGIDILQYILKQKKVPVFATGSGPLALKIELKMGFKLVGELRKYMGIIHPIFMLSSLFRGKIPIQKYPKIIKTRNISFRLIENRTIPNFEKPYNNEVLEFVRDRSFMLWRFFSNIHVYAVYVQNDSDNYFVLRTIIIKNVTFLALVDYRCNLANKEDFKIILDAAQKITKKLKLGALITGSSLNGIDAILESHKFKSLGRPRPIIVSKSFTEDINNIKDKIINRNFIFVTLADSDGEILW